MADRAPRPPQRRFEAEDLPHRAAEPRAALDRLAVLLIVAVGYVQPLRPTATPPPRRRAQGRGDRLAGANVRLEQRIAETETPEFVEREARKLTLVQPGERLYIVTGSRSGSEAGASQRAPNRVSGKARLR